MNSTLDSNLITPTKVKILVFHGGCTWLQRFIGAAAAFLIMRRRAADAAKEIADIFSSAELLAAGIQCEKRFSNAMKALFTY